MSPETEKKEALPEEFYHGDKVATAIEQIADDVVDLTSEFSDSGEEVDESALLETSDEAKKEVPSPSEEEAEGEEKVEVEDGREELESGEEPERVEEKAEEGEEAVEEVEEGEGEGELEPEPEPEPDHIAALRDQNASLIAMLNQHGVIPGQPALTETKPAVPVAPVAAPMAPVPTAPARVAELSDEDFQTITDNKEAFVEYIAQVAAEASGRALSAVPSIVGEMTRTQQEISSFFAKEENEDVLPLALYVQRRAVEYEAAHPEYAGNVEKILSETAALVRKEGMLTTVSSRGDGKVEARRPRKRRVQRSRFAKAPGSRGPVTTPKSQGRNSIASQIDDMAGLEF